MINLTVAAIMVIAVIFILCQVSDEIWRGFGQKEFLRITDVWGNDRGKIWRMGVGGFRQGNVINKLFGAGPDCFYYVIAQYDSVNAAVHTAGQWENAVYANAHNEWLNMLVNQGIFGLAAYGGIFTVQFVRLWKYSAKSSLVLWGLMAISGYCAYGIVSFQQVMSTPLMFAVLGISEAVIQRDKMPVALSRDVQT